MSPSHGRHITRPCIIFITANHSKSEKTRVRHSISPFLCWKQVLAARDWARIGRQVHTGVIIREMARYWQPIFDLPMLVQSWAVSNFALGLFWLRPDFMTRLNSARTVHCSVMSFSIFCIPLDLDVYRVSKITLDNCKQYLIGNLPLFCRKLFL